MPSIGGLAQTCSNPFIEKQSLTNPCVASAWQKMIPKDLTVLQLQEHRGELHKAIEEALRQFVQKTGVIAYVESCRASPRFADGTVEIDLCVYCGLSPGLEDIPPPAAWE